MLPNPFSFILLHNLKLVHTRDECDAGFFQVNLTGTVDVTDGEDLAVELSCLPVHTAGVINFDNAYFCSPFNHGLVLHDFEFVSEDFPAAPVSASLVSVTLDAHTTENSDDLAFPELVQAGDLVTLEAGHVEPGAVDNNASCPVIGCFSAYGETSDSCVSDRGYLHSAGYSLDFDFVDELHITGICF